MGQYSGTTSNQKRVGDHEEESYVEISIVNKLYAENIIDIPLIGWRYSYILMW